MIKTVKVNLSVKQMEAIPAFLFLIYLAAIKDLGNSNSLKERFLQSTYNLCATGKIYKLTIARDLVPVE